MGQNQMSELHEPAKIKSIIDKVTEQFRGQDLFTSSSYMPAWLESLPTGTYTVKELVLISKKGERNVAKVMKKYWPLFCLNTGTTE